jgi:hypothetical protein
MPHVSSHTSLEGRGGANEVSLCSRTPAIQRYEPRKGSTWLLATQQLMIRMKINGQTKASAVPLAVPREFLKIDEVEFHADVKRALDIAVQNWVILKETMGLE